MKKREAAIKLRDLVLQKLHPVQCKYGKALDKCLRPCAGVALLTIQRKSE